MELARTDRLPGPRSLLVAAAASAVLTALAILVLDQPVARWIAQYEPPAVWDRGIEVLEYAIGLPVHRIFTSLLLAGLMLAAIAVPRWRGWAPSLILIAGTHIVARFATGKLKDATGRLRPNEWLRQGGDETFGWDGGIAFPSGHVVLFASILIPLAVIAPRTRPLLVLVGFAMVARVAVNGHYVSDVVGAITLVTLVCWAIAWAVRPLRPRRT